MPAKLNMFLSNGNRIPTSSIQSPNTSGFGIATPKPTVKPQSTLNAPMITRVQNVRTGCGSCGR